MWSPQAIDAPRQRHGLGPRVTSPGRRGRRLKDLAHEGVGESWCRVCRERAPPAPAARGSAPASSQGATGAQAFSCTAMLLHVPRLRC